MFKKTVIPLAPKDLRLCRRLCSKCGAISGQRAAQHKKWECKGCGAILDREENTRINTRRLVQDTLAITFRSFSGGNRPSKNPKVRNEIRRACEESYGPVADRLNAASFRSKAERHLTPSGPSGEIEIFRPTASNYYTFTTLCDELAAALERNDAHLVGYLVQKIETIRFGLRFGDEIELSRKISSDNAERARNRKVTREPTFQVQRDFVRREYSSFRAMRKASSWKIFLEEWLPARIEKIANENPSLARRLKPVCRLSIARIRQIGLSKSLQQKDEKK